MRPRVWPGLSDKRWQSLTPECRGQGLGCDELAYEMTPTLSSAAARSTYSHNARIRMESKRRTPDPESALTLTMTSNVNRLVAACPYDSTYAWVNLTTAQWGTDCSLVFLPCDRTEGLKVAHPRSHTHSTRQLPPAQPIHKPFQKPEAKETPHAYSCSQRCRMG